VMKNFHVWMLLTFGKLQKVNLFKF
jgi:hypothetical protein